MAEIPSDPRLDSTASFRADPYLFISRRCRELGTDVFEARLLLRRTICMTGPAAARLFYDPKRFQRAGASPEAVRATLFGKGGVQGLDGEAHRHRKHMFMSFMTPASIQYLAARVLDETRLHAAKWQGAGRVVLYDEFLDILARAACQWAGVPIEEPGFDNRVRDLALLFGSAANSIGGHMRARVARKRSERWAAGLVRSVRAGRLKVPEDRALHIIAHHREMNGQPLSGHIAGVELLNTLRPITAVAVYIVLAAHALHSHRELVEHLHQDANGYIERFVLEVRRFYPFFPAVVARVLMEFEWKGYVFPTGRRVMLDVYGTNHDDRTWRDPETFNPDRFRTWDRSAYNFIAQGGGDHYLDHRCPGEWITIELMKTAVRFLAEELRYEVPQQDLRIDFRNLPALPGDRFVIANARSIALHATSPREDYLRGGGGAKP
jgi:fatty-acid peroxygenase